MKTWIFQGNPDVFDIDGYLATKPLETLWTVTRYADQIAIGDQVFLWKSRGKDPGGESGIIAECVVAGPVVDQSDAGAARPFYRNPSDSSLTHQRISLKLVRVAGRKERLKRDWLLNDSKLRSLAILKQAAGTNFPVTPTEAERLNALWDNTGTDWKRDEVMAALKVYESLFGQPISKIAGSPVEQLAQSISRVPDGVYNKLMNLRALDPRVEQKGFEGGSKVDKVVWDEYFNHTTNRVDTGRLATDLERLWSGSPGVRAEHSQERFEGAVEQLAKSNLDGLLAIYKARQRTGQPARKLAAATQFERDPVVAAIARVRAGNRCEVPACTGSGFISTKGEPYVEVHHLVRLADGGLDTIENTVCVCPNHHRELHHGAKRDELCALLKEVRTQQ